MEDPFSKYVGTKLPGKDIDARMAFSTARVNGSSVDIHLGP